MKNIWQRYFNFSDNRDPKINYSHTIIALFIYAYKLLASFIGNLYIVFCNFFIALTMYIEYLGEVTFIVFFIFFGRIITFLRRLHREFLLTVISYSLFNFIFFIVSLLVCLGYFLNDAELMLFFSCLLVIFSVGAYINEVLDTALEEYSNAIAYSLFDKFYIQLSSYAFEVEMNERLKILDEFLFYSVIFIEQQLNEYVELQKNLFFYHYSKVTELNLLADAEELFTKEHIEALTNFVELERFVSVYLIVELLNEEFEIIDTEEEIT